ncbi:hypothetical protein TruAng_004388 [Truncatella angustata]|nr:hypothetical protein TruAng_004388 [Truncatella angustata]
MQESNDVENDLEVLKEIADVCGIQLQDIEDVYPCTPLQVGIMAQPIERIYINCVYTTLVDSIDIERFCGALRQIASINPVLRTRIVDCEFGLVQVILRETLAIERSSRSLSHVLDQEKGAPMRFGTPLFRVVLIGRNLVLTTHHAISDGGTYHRLFDNISRVYHGQSIPPYAEFKLFVKHCLEIEENTAKSFWGSRFNGQPTVFPKIDVEYIPDASKRLVSRIEFGPWGLGVPLGLMSSYVETAWAITAMSYTNSQSIAFGRVLSGRVSGLNGLESTLGPTIVTMPVQVNLKGKSTIAGIIRERAQERREALKSPALHYGLTRIRHVNEAARVASAFTALLNFRTPTDSGRDYSNSDMEIHGEYEPHLPYGLGISIVVNDTGLSVETLFDENVVCKAQTLRILRQFEHILHFLLKSPGGTQLEKLQLLNPHDRREIFEWNETIPNPPLQSLHNMFRGAVKIHPNAEAIQGPDGHLNYKELDTISDVVASDLQYRGVGAEDAIGLVFEKSIWAIVAQLAVLKAGAVCVPIDPDFPSARKETIIAISKIATILTSSAYLEALRSLASEVLVIDAQSVSQLPRSVNLHPSGEDDSFRAAFILFTSGSTGTPKGHVLEHGNLVSSLVAIGRDMGWGTDVRMLQFASYVWDMSIAEIFGTLTSGGCVCVPSEEARESFIAEFIESVGVNCAIFTPTVLRMITPEEAPSMKTIMSIGEPVDLGSVKLWSGHARFFNAWGPSETACVSAMAELTPTSRYAESIGRPLASALWLVDENNVDKLVPIGGVGEIVVESPGVSRGYLNDPNQTAASFIAPPRWAPPRKESTSTKSQRMYRTGDLARYNPDGSLEYIGRRDNQVKISGQRVELAEIEKALAACSAVRSAITSIQTIDNGHKSLVAVVSLEEPCLSRRTPLKEVSAEFQSEVEEGLNSIRKALYSRVPIYMVPNVWRVVEELPRTASLKIDRSAVRSWLAQWEPTHFEGSGTDALTPPTNEVEQLLHTVWCAVLTLQEDEIGRESSFIKLGGDSILAINIATKCRKRGLRVSVATLLRSESLANVAAASELLPGHSDSLGERPMMYGSNTSLHQMDEKDTQEIYAHLNEIGVHEADVEVLLPCSPLQEGILFSQLKSSGRQYWMRLTMKLTPTSSSNKIDDARLMVAWEAAYDNPTSLPKARSLSQYFSWVVQRNEVTHDYWTTHLSGVTPCLVPLLDAAESKLMDVDQYLCDVPIDDARYLNLFCRQRGLTVANLLQTAWCIVLRQCTRTEGVVFGFLRSDLGPMEDAENMMGPLLAMAVCKFEAAPDSTLTQILRDLSSNLSHALEYGTCPLSDIHEAVGVGQLPLFNTIMTIYRLWPDNLSRSGSIQIEHLPLHGYTEYPLTLGVGYDDDNIVSKLLYDPSKIPRSFAKNIANLFASVITNILANPEQTLRSLESSITSPLCAFSTADIARTVILRAASQIETTRNCIEEIHPCIPTQSREMEASIRRGSDSLDQYIFKVDNYISSTGLRKAGDLVAKACPILRTRIINLEQYGTCQVIINTPPAWIEEHSLSEYLQWDKDCPIRYGRPLCRFGEVREQNGPTYFVLSLHYSLCDPWAVAIILNGFEKACTGDPLQSVQSLPTVHRLSNWKESVSDGAKMTQVPKACHEGLQFPRVASKNPSASLSSSRSISFSRYIENDTLQAAWVLCLSRITGENHICFGLYLACRSPLTEDTSDTVGPVGAVVPFSLNFSTLLTVESLLGSVRKITDECTSLLSTRSVSKAFAPSQETHAADSFANVLVIDTSSASLLHPAPKIFKLIQTNRSAGSFGNASLVVSCTLLPNHTLIDMQFDKEAISPETVDILLEQYNHAIQQLLSHPSSSLADLESLSDHEASLLQAWNRHIPAAVDTCVHEQTRIVAGQHIGAPAIYSWDYELNHGMLDDLSDRMAVLLQKEGVTVGVPIPYFFEKSAVSIVVMLGILKAGGALLPMDINHPSERIACILSESCAPKIVTSFNLLAKVNAKIDAPKLIVVDMNLIQNLAPGRPAPVDIKSSDTCYIIYTSGSTGKPKGTVITHSNFSTSLKYRRDLVKMTPETRTLQYLNFIFDVSMFDIFLTLVSGGCVCMPSQYEWFNDIAGAIRRTRANFVFLTPSLATLLNPSEVPTLRTLGLTGESSENHIIEQWKQIRVLNMYGPAEATVHSSGCEVSFGSGKQHLNIGRPDGCLYWVVDPNDHNKLMSIGCPGELLIQGPIVSPGYLGNPSLTSTVFIEPPSWISRFKIQDHSQNGISSSGIKPSQRCYKTGDIAIQTPDGSVIYQGRKDTQVKLNGLRIELGEIEYHIRRVLKAKWVVAVELIKPSGQDDNHCLAVFLAIAGPDQPEASKIACKVLPPVQKEASALRSALTVSLPTYMVPQFFVHLEKLPLTRSGKTDRSLLRKTGAMLSPRQLSFYDPSQETLNSTTKLPPSIRSDSDNDTESYPTCFEDELRRLWSETLALPCEAINKTDDFFNIGGSSIRAMRLAHAAHRSGILLSAADVFKSSTLSDMATVARRIPSSMASTRSDRSMGLTMKLIQSNPFLASCRAQVASSELIHLVRDNIESIAEATDVQADMVAVGELDGEAWHNEFTIEAPSGLNVSNLIKAFKEATLGEMITIDGPEKRPISCPVNWDTYFPKFHLSELSDDGKTCHKISLKIHHAHYDAISVDVVLQDLRRAYSGRALSTGPHFYEWFAGNTAFLPRQHSIPCPFAQCDNDLWNAIQRGTSSLGAGALSRNRSKRRHILRS